MASAASIEELMGDVIGGNDDESTVSHFLETGFPPLNEAITASYSNGLPVGRFVEIFGPPSSGKTAIATNAMAAAQAAGGIAMFMDHERSFSLKLAPKLGLSIDPSKLIFKKPVTFEDSISLVVRAATAIRASKLIAADAPICAVFDSLASMVPQSAYYDQKTGKAKEAGDRSMNDNTALARATSAAMPAFAQHCEELGICAIFLNQTRTKLGVMYGDPTTTPGGDAPKFYASVRIQLSAKQIVKGSGADKEVLGQEVTARIVKNKVARPFRTAKWRFLFLDDGTGKFDVVGSMVDFLIEQKVLVMSGARVQWTNGKSYFKGELVEKIEKEGLFDELKAMLPKDPVTASEDESEEA